MSINKSLIAGAIITSVFTAPAAFAFKEYPAGEAVKIN